MNEVVVITLMMGLAATAAFMCAIATVGGLQLSRKFPDGILHYSIYALFLSGAIEIASLNRAISAHGQFATAAPGIGGGLGGWAVRATSTLLVLGCIDQLRRYLRTRPKICGNQAVLLVSFLFFWLASTVAPALFSTHTDSFHLAWAYTLILTPALLTLSEDSAARVLLASRNAIVLFCAASLLLMVLKPGMVLDFDYSQGYVPGLPRLLGLAAHPVAMGICAGLGVWCVMVRPFAMRWLNRAAWACCLMALMLSQAKASIITGLLGVLILLYYRHSMDGLRKKRLADMNILYGLAFFLAATVLLALFFYIILGIGQGTWANFLQSRDGASLLTLTGRDKIWAIALAEWRAAPVFGYGLPIFGEEYRAMIHMGNATSGHSQIYDALGRAGSVGAAGAAIYLSVLLVAGFKYAKTTSGLSLVLAMSLLLRAVSEVAVGVRGFATADIAQYLLMAVLAGAIIKSRRVAGLDDRSTGAARSAQNFKPR